MSGVSGYVQSISFDQTAKEATLEDAYGETVAVEYFDAKVDAKAELKFESSVTDVAIGDILTISGAKFAAHNGAYILTKIGESHSNKDFASFSVEMQRFLANSIPVEASASA
jgi:hypothetical protein